MSYDSITNRGDYLSPHYLAEVLPRDLTKKTSLRTRWAERDKAGEPAPVKGLRGLRRDYFDTRLSLQESSESSQLRQKELKEQEIREVSELNGSVLRALGFTAAPQMLAVGRAGEPFEVPVAYYGQNVLAVDCAWATDTDAAFDADGGLEIGEFIAAFESRFSVLADHEDDMYFDANGRKLAADYDSWGHGQTKEHWEQFQAYLEDPERNPVPDGYTAPFYKAGRIAEYRQAHAAFSARLAAADTLQVAPLGNEGDL